MLSLGLPLTQPSEPRDAGVERFVDEPRPKNATQLYREIDRLMTTLVRTTELRLQQEA